MSAIAAKQSVDLSHRKTASGPKPSSTNAKRIDVLAHDARRHAVRIDPMLEHELRKKRSIVLRAQTSCTSF
jgi:hypothetical protein